MRQAPVCGVLYPPLLLKKWRQGCPPSPTSVAVVSGTFDILQPGNLLALLEANRQARHVCVVLEDDETAASHSRRGRPRHPLSARAEFLAQVALIHAITSVPRAHAVAAFEALSPYTWVCCPNQPAADPLAAIAARFAGQTIHLPVVDGCFTEQIEAAVQAGRTPIAVPEGRFPALPPGAPEARPAGGGRVTVNGCFDILHLGHLRLFAAARQMGKELHVLLNDDTSVRRYKGPTRPVFPLPFRAAAVRALKAVTQAHAFGTDEPLELLASLKPEVHVKGGSFREERVQRERELVESWGGKVVVCPLVPGYSTSGYIQRATGSA